MNNFSWGENGSVWGGENGSTWGVGPASTPDGLTASATAADTIELSWSLVGNVDGVTVHRARSPSSDLSDYSEVGVLDAVESYTDDELINGRAYHYRVTATNAVAESDPTADASATTELPDPTVAFGTDSAREVGVAVTLADDNDEGDVTITRDHDGETVATLTDLDDLTATDADDILDGEQYVYHIERDTGDATATVTGDTVAHLPDEQPPELGNGVKDEIAVERDQVTNNGDVRYQLRRTADDTDEWEDADSFKQFIGSFDTLSWEFAGLLDGERYEVRGRTETADATGAWTRSTAITTAFPAVVDLSVDAVEQLSVGLSWTDRADNEDGQRIIRERRVDGGEWGRKRIVEDVGANTESYTDDTAQPNREYRYRIEAYTPFTSAESDTVTAETPALEGVRTTRVPASGWRVEVDHPASDQPLTPTVLEGAEWNPRLNGKPEIRVPVPRSSTWEDHAVEGSTVRAWKDGTRLPIDTLRDVERDETKDVLVAIGGRKLDEDVEGVEIPEADAHEAAREQIEEGLGWIANVDDPETAAREGVQLLSTSSTSHFVDAIEGASDADNDDYFGETNPLTIFSGEVYSRRTAVFQEAEDVPGDGSSRFADADGNDGAWSGNEVIRLPPGGVREFDFDPDYVVPEGEAIAEFVFAVPDDPAPGLEIRIDIDGGGTETLESFGEGALNSGDDRFDLRTFNTALNNTQDLPPGSHTVEFQVDPGSGGDVYLDFAHIRDDRFEYDLGDTDPIDEVVTGWQQYPEALELVFSPVGSVEQVTGGELDVELSEGETPVELALRNATTDAWTTATETSTITTEFGEPTQLIQARVTLGRNGSGVRSGTFGDTPDRLDTASISADLINTPVVLDLTHDGSYEELLNRIADAGDSIWELRPTTPDVEAPYRIEWTQPGQRVGDADPTLVSFDGKRTIEGSYQRVVARGKSSRVTGEEWTSNSVVGLLTGVDNAPLKTGSVTITDPDGDEAYERNVDYEVDHRIGGIRVLEGGSMETDTTYEVDYEWHYEGEYTQPGVDDPDTLREEFPDAASDRECEQLALAVVRQVAEPLEEADVTIRETEPDRSLVASLPADELPFDGPMRNREVTTDSREVSLRLGSRQSTDDFVDDLNDRLRAVARNV